MKKKILIISTSLYGGGAEKVLVTFLRNIDYSLFEVHLNLEYDFGVSYEPIPEEVKVSFRYKRTDDWRSKIDYHLYRFLRVNIFEPNRIKRKVDAEYDAIISFVEGKPLKYHRYVADRTKNNITWVHADMMTNHYTIGRTLSSKHEEEAYRMMNKIVFVSGNAKAQFEKLFVGLGGAKCTVVYNPIDKDGIVRMSCSDTSIKKSRATLVSLGRLSKEKGVDRLLRVAKMLNEKGCDYDLWIVGDGVMKEELLEWKTNAGLTNVYFLGFKNPPYPWLATADIFVSPSYTEAAPVVLCEAMVLGIPVVATRTAGALEILDNGKWGLITEQDDESLCDAISALLDSEEMRLKYKLLATERASLWSIENSMKQFSQLVSDGDI